MIKNICNASKIITVDGIEGYYSVVNIVGKEIALGMLILFLRLQLNPNKMYPEPENIQERIEEILKDNNIEY